MPLMKKHLSLIVFVLWVITYFTLVFPFTNREVQAVIVVFGTLIITRATKGYVDSGRSGLMFWRRSESGECS